MTYTATVEDARLIEDSLARAVVLAADGSDTALEEVVSITGQLALTTFEGVEEQEVFRNNLMRRVRDRDPSAWTVTRMRLAGPRVILTPPACDHCGSARHARWCRHNRSA